MIQHFIVTNTFTHKIDCFCPGEEHVELVRFKVGDVIEVLGERKYTFNNGWYILILINNQSHFYLSLDDLENYYCKGQILTLLDVELETNYIQFKINQALDTKNEVSFLNYTTEWNKLLNLQEKVNIFLNRAESTLYI